jgi:hypothetical protein
VFENKGLRTIFGPERRYRDNGKTVGVLSFVDR